MLVTTLTPETGSDVLDWYRMSDFDCSLVYQDTLLSLDPNEVRILAVTAGDIDGDAHGGDILTLELPAGQSQPRVNHYEFDLFTGQLNNIGPLTIPTEYEITGIALGDWDSQGNTDLLTIECEYSDPNRFTHVINYSCDPNGIVHFENNLLTVDSSQRNLKSISIGRDDGGIDPVLFVVDSIFNDSATAIEKWTPTAFGLFMTDSILVTDPNVQRIIGASAIPDANECSVPCYWEYQPYAMGDLNHSCLVDLVDFSKFAARWLDINCLFPQFCDGADIDGDTDVDTDDLKAFSGDFTKTKKKDACDPLPCAAPSFAPAFDTVFLGGFNEGFWVEYPVDGNNCGEVFEDLFDKTTGKGFVDPKTGNRYAGVTTPDWEQFESDAKTITRKCPGGTKFVTKAKFFTVRFGLMTTVEIPKWTPPSGAQAEDVDAWNMFIDAVKVHEQGHVDIYKTGYANLINAINAIPDQIGCGDSEAAAKNDAEAKLNDAAGKVLKAEVAKIKKAHDKYETDTNHGPELTCP